MSARRSAKGQVEEAARLLERAYREGDRSVRLLIGRARLADRRGKVRAAARRALERIERGAPGGGGPADRGLLLRAARLEALSGDRDRAAEWLLALSRAGLLRDSELRDLPALMDLAPPGPDRPRPRNPVR